MSIVTEDLEKLAEKLDLFQDDTAIQTDVENHTLSSEDSPYTLELKRTDFDEEKELEKFVKACERLVRSSPEYRIWTNYVRDTLGYYRCEITGEQHSQTSVDIHHHPYSLFAIVKGVVMKYMASETSFCSYNICEEVIKLHYELRAPFCLIVSSLHEKFHNGFLLLPMDIVHGDKKYFLKHYFPFLDDDEQQTITTRLAINRSNCGWEEYNWVKSDGHN